MTNCTLHNVLGQCPSLKLNIKTTDENKTTSIIITIIKNKTVTINLHQLTENLTAYTWTHWKQLQWDFWDFCRSIILFVSSTLIAFLAFDSTLRGVIQVKKKLILKFI